MSRRQIKPKQGIKSVGPYSMAIQVGTQVFVSEQLPLNDEGICSSDDITQQTRFAIENLERVLTAASLSLEDVVKTTVYLANFDDFDKMNQMYAIYFSHPYPARSCVGVNSLPKGVRISLDCIAISHEEVLFEEDIDEDCEGCCCD